MKKFVSFVGALFLTSLFMMPKVSMASASKAVADGSFIQPTLCANWTDARWQEEFAAMKAAGMDYLVLQWVASCTTVLTPRGGTINEVTTYYPSSLSNAAMDSSLNGHDMVDACLRNAESAGIKVFIGIDQNNGEWYNGATNDSTWLYGQMNLDNQICDELWSLYKNKYPDAFYGWYWSYEVYYTQIETQAQQNVLTHAMNIQLDHLAAANEKLPFLWCPSFLGSATGTPQAYGAMWKNVFAGLHTDSTDIFCPQDGIGAGLLTLSNVASWFSTLRQAVDTKPGLKMWSDVETFNISNFSSATLNRFIEQMKLEQPYVDNYITFAYCHYYSPYITDPGFQETYVDYLKTGSLESIPPSAPPNFTAKSLPGQVDLSWGKSTDDIGVCGYIVYRNGQQISKMQVSTGDGPRPPLATSFTDGSVGSNVTYTYEVRAYDFAGNLSDSSSATVTIGNYNDVALGRPYTVSPAPSSNYPDPSGTKLTDGKSASSASYTDNAWVGFPNPDTLVVTVTIDLGQSMPVQQFVGDYLLELQPEIFLPKEVDVSVSTDGVNFTKVGVLQDSSTNDTSTAIHTLYCTLSSPVNARYVRFTTTAKAGGGWIFVDEFEVFPSSTTAIRPQPSLAPAKFTLYQNYPNPFNPSTNITFTVAKSEQISLKIYDVLGELVATVFDGIAHAHQHYTINVRMSRFASGVYFYRLRQGPNVMTKRMILLK